MRRYVSLFAVALLAGTVTLGGYKFLVESPKGVAFEQATEHETGFMPVSYTGPLPANAPTDFTGAAEKTVHAVVHVKNRTVMEGYGDIFDYFRGRTQQREIVGSGSGVIISPTGHIVTNNHVIDNATELEVTLNDNRSFPARLIGTDPKTDIALLKIDVGDDLPYLPFANSNDLKIGEWVLAVGNPFNLTSTVTAGIVSAKARNLNEFDGDPQSFIQTDAAVNRGNSGGALVNINGELVGINTAITSQTGTFIGYSFAVPSNITRKVVEDILEFGDVQRAIMGIQILNINSKEAKDLGVGSLQGLYVAEVEDGSGAQQAGLKKGDIITRLDNTSITRFSELSGYLSAKRPGETIRVTVRRKNRELELPVRLSKLEFYEIEPLGLEVRNATRAQLDATGAENGVVISRVTSGDMRRYNLAGTIVTALNDEPVHHIDDVKRVMQNRMPGEPVSITLMDQQGKTNTYIIR